MKKKYIISTCLFFYCWANLLLGCGCEIEGPFLKVAPATKLIAVVKVKEYLSFKELEGIEVPMSMEVEILQTLKGLETRRYIKVWGNNGLMCRPYLALFEPNSTWVMAFGEDGSVGHDEATSDDYGVSHCGEYFMPVQMGIVSGFIGSEQFEEMSIGALEAKLDILNREKGLMDFQKCQFINQLLWQGVDTIGVFESDYINYPPRKFQLKANMFMVADDAYPDFYDFIKKIGVSRQFFIFWQKEGQYFVKQIDNCIEHDILEISYTDFFDIYFHYGIWLKKEVLQLPKLSHTKKLLNQKKGPRKLLINLMIRKAIREAPYTEHSIQLIFKDKVYLRTYDMRLFDKKHNKKNYKRNQELLTHGWLEILKEELEFIVDENSKSRNLFKQYKKLMVAIP